MSIEELLAPAEVNPDWAAMVRVRNEVKAEAVGNADLAIEPDELLPRWHNPHEIKRAVVARVDGEIVGRGVYETEADSTAAWVSVEVLRAYRNRGIGADLHERLVQFAVADGKTALQLYVTEKVSDAIDVIPSPTGFGSVPAAAPSTRFLLKHGYALEQVGRMSVLDLPVDVSTFLREATDAAGPDYAIHTYTHRTPDEYLDDIALLRSSMGTDAPSAGMDTESEWTAERVRADEDAAAESPRIWITAIAHHVPTGQVAGYTELDVPPELDRPVAQGDTIVVAGHRGHSLGMLLKVANIKHLAEFAPGHPAITSSNAEDNTHMLAVNEAVGFVGWASMGAWKRSL